MNIIFKEGFMITALQQVVVFLKFRAHNSHLAVLQKVPKRFVSGKKTFVYKKISGGWNVILFL